MGFQEEPSGGGSATPRTFTSASTPTVAEDSSSGYRVGDKWIVTGDDGVSSGYVYECTDNSVGAALWFPPQRYPVPPAELPSAINATKIANGTISNTEFQYLNNVSSSIQTQLDAKAPLAIGPTIAGLTSKSTPVTDDDFLISDSAASDVAKRVTYGDLLTTLTAALGGGVAMCCCAYRSTDISLTTTPTAVTFNNNLTITDAAIHSTSSNTSRFVVPTGGAGKWRFRLACNGSGAAAYLNCEGYKNGSKVTGCELGIYANGYAGPQVEWILDLADGDYFEFYLWLSAGTASIYSSNNLAGGYGGYTHAIAQRIGD